MHIRRVIAPDIRQALRRVREEAGPDAVILSNRRVEGGIELVAALDYDDEALADAALPAPEPEDRPIRHAAPTAAPVAPVPGDAALASVYEELGRLRQLVEGQFAEWTWQTLGRRQPARAELLRYLDTLGFMPEIATRLADAVPDGLGFEESRVRAASALTGMLPCAGDVLDHGGVIALVGPTGVGKTTTLAKLAARHCLRHGARSLALITTDNWRIGARQQLFDYGRILDVGVRAVANAAELAEALDQFATRHLVLVDTSGMGQRDARLTAELDALFAAPATIRPWLVIEAGTERRRARETVRAFARLPLAGAVLTKQDECTSPGGALGALIETALPIVCVTDGQRVPEDLRPARATDLAQHCFGMEIAHV